MKRISTPFLFIVLALFIVRPALSQRVIGGSQLDLDDNAGHHAYLTTLSSSMGINGSALAPNTCALLDLASTTKGFLVPRMTTAQELALCGGTPPEGLIVYNLSNHTLDVYNGTIWGASGWALNGNNLTGGTPATPSQFFGSDNNFDVVMQTNGIERMRLGSSAAANAVTVTSAPTAANGIQVNGTAGTAKGVSVDMNTNPVSTFQASMFSGTITGTSGNSVSGGNFTVNGSGNFGGATGIYANASVTGTGAPIGISATATAIGATPNNGVLAGQFNATGAANTSQTTGITSQVVSTNANPAFGGIFFAVGSSGQNVGLQTQTSGGTGTNIGVDVQSTGAGSIGVRVGTGSAPVTGISITNASTTGINIAGAPTSVNASGTIQTTGNNNSFGNSTATNNVLVVNGIADATIANTAANAVWDSRVNGDQLVTGIQKIGGSIWLDGTTAGNQKVVSDDNLTVGTNGAGKNLTLTAGAGGKVIITSPLQTVPEVVNWLGAYAGGTTYNANDLVTSTTPNTYFYSLTSGNIGNTPETSPLSWAPVSIEQLHLIHKTLPLTSPAFVSFMSTKLTGTNTASGRIQYIIVATDGGAQIATEQGILQYVAESNTISCNIQAGDKLSLGTVNSGCSPGFYLPGNQPGVGIFDNVSFNVAAPIVTHDVYYRIYPAGGQFSAGAVTPTVFRLEP
jgi:hypothetical protein